MSRRTARRIGSARGLLLACACSIATACSSPTGLSRDLADARARWSDAAIMSYQVTVYRDCGECPVGARRAVIVTVRNGVVASRRYADTGELVPATSASIFPSVDEMFGVIDGAIGSRAYKLDAQYDPTLGFPSSVFIDYNAQTVDDETSYSLTAFRPL